MPQDLIADIDGLRKYRRAFILSPDQWRTLDIPNLEWKNVKFNLDNKELIPKERGVYTFVIKHDNALFPGHGYIAYIGLTGDRNERTLRIRYSDYLRDQKRPKRVNIYELLNKWKDDIYFSYAVIPDKQISLSDIETKLLDSLVPPFNKKDFSGEFGKIVAEAWL